MMYEVSEQDKNDAKHPHDIFLINLIVNHILVFVGLIGMATSYPYLMLIVPAISAIVLTYIMMRAKRSLKEDSWFVKCHWQLCAQRSKIFIIMIALMAVLLAAVMLIAGGDPKPQHYAIGGVVMLPVLVTVLVLIIMESDAVNQARHGQLPKSLAERFPNPNAVVLSED